MSKKRSISKKINPKQLNFPLPEPSNNLPNLEVKASDKCIQDIYFGERIQTENSSSNTSDLFNYYSSIRDELSYTGGSTTSAEDDLEIEATKKVSTEFEKLNNFLYGEEKISTNNGKEYNLWTEKFPHLRIIGSAMKIHPASADQCQTEYYEEIIAEHLDFDCSLKNDEDKLQSNSSKIKEAVINSVIKEVSSKVLGANEDSCQIYSLSNEVTPTNDDQSERSFQFDSSCNQTKESLPSTSDGFLQVTSQPLRISPYRNSNFDYRSPIMRSHLSASKWQKDDSVDYSSLPHIITNSSVPYTNIGSRNSETLSANKSEISMNSSSASFRRKLEVPVIKSNSGYTNSPRTRNLTLPPIQNLNLDVDKDRCVSATPKKLFVRPISNKFNRF